MDDDPDLARDPDELLGVPDREVSATLGLLRGLVRLMDDQEDLAAALADGLGRLDDDEQGRLPEVGPVQDAESLRLHLHRLHDRLAGAVPGPASVLPPPPVTVPADAAVPIRRTSRSAAVVDDDLADFFVWWDDITSDDVESYEDVLSAVDSERPLQRHLALNPRLLVQHLGGGQGRWVIPHSRLGSEFVPDFIIGERGLETVATDLQVCGPDQDCLPR